MKVASVAEVFLWGTRVGAVAWDSNKNIGVFEYDKKFLGAPVELSPIMMPKKASIYTFSNLSNETFKGLPGLLADSLPDKFGNLLIEKWLSQQGKTVEDFNPVDRLSYMGDRGMGALEYVPSFSKEMKGPKKLDVDSLVDLANFVLKKKNEIKGNFSTEEETNRSLLNILRVGTSAGGARAKAIIKIDEKTEEVYSDSFEKDGLSHWILKLDGVSHNGDKELSDPIGYGAVEYAYYLMARACGIEMNECRLLRENSRSHFMARRFDRLENGDKLHMQSLCALAHYDFNHSGFYSYEQGIQVIYKLRMDNEKEVLEEFFRRAIFNVMARNQDDHTKNIAFLMDRRGNWKLSPAFDVTYSYNPQGAWTSQHQMSINGKRDHFELVDFYALGAMANLKDHKIDKILSHCAQTIKDWPRFGAQAQVRPSWIEEIGKNHRLTFKSENRSE